MDQARGVYALAIHHFKKDNVHRFINNRIQYDQQTNDIINSDENGKVIFKKCPSFYRY